MDIILIKPKDTADVQRLMLVIGEIKGVDSAKIFKADGAIATVKQQLSTQIADSIFKEA